jgi:outer membrane protein assembly factor BamB
MRRCRAWWAVVAVAGLAGAMAPSAAVWASSPGSPSAAPGGVSCALSATVSFSPPLTLTGGGTSPSAVTGTLSGCTTTSPAVTITGGTVSGSFAASPLNCATLTATGASSSLSLSWTGSGSFTPTTITSTSEKVVANGNHDKGLALPGTGTTSTATGSFAGNAKATAYSPDTATKLTSLCSAAGGVASLTLTGTISIHGGLPGWPQLHYGPDRAGDQPNEAQIDTGNAGKLSQARTYPVSGGAPSAPLIANGVLFVATNKLYAFNAAGATGCSASPATCTPLWTAPAANFDGMTIANGKVFVTDAEGVQAYDAAGKKDCTGSGTTKTCAALWATSTNTSTGPGFTPGQGSPLVANGVLYVPGYGDGIALSQGGAYVAAFDPAGTKGCSGTPKVCVPLWTTTGPPTSTGNTGSPAIANGVLYLADGTLFAFDAAGSTNCSGSPKACAPLWTAATTNEPTYSAPAVANGIVYVGSWGSKLYAFDATGTTNCSGTTTKTCTPLWTAATPSSIGGTPAVAGGVVYTVSADGTLSAFNAAGTSHCSGPVTARTCKPLWSSATGGTGYATSSSPAIANGVVYFSSTNGGTYGYDAAGTKDCMVSGTVKTCSPLWGAVSGFIGGGSPAIVNGVVFINVSGDSTIYAYTP